MSSKRFSLSRFSKAFAVSLCLIFSGNVFADTTSTAAGADAKAAGGAVAGDVALGQTVFEANCASCHAVHSVVIGPALKDITKRKDIAWIKKWIKNPAAVIASGDPYAVKLAAEYKGAGVMSAFASLKEAEVDAILAYVETAPEPPKPGAGGTSKVPSDGSGVSSTFVNFILIVFVFILILLVVVLGLILSVLKKYLSTKEDTFNDDEKYLANQSFGLEPVIKSTGFLFVVGFLVFGLLGKATLDNLMAIGIQQGYAPKQPIPFSHKLHAGKYKIDCNYCHTGVRNSKNANIPSTNICMNCHSHIKTDSPKLEPLRNAVKNGTPIEWVRIHNLPDLAYFNHSQHVKVGGIECQTCHGPIEKMEVVQQYSPLTMGWCINCHRQTVVKTEGNAYYDKLVEVHKHNGQKELKVKDIGGIECSKCHY